MKKIFYTIISISLLNIICGQNAKIDLQKLAKKKNYSERTFILKDTSSQIKLYQDIYYNKKGVIDEEYSYTLTFFVFDTLLAKKKHIINCHDSIIAKISYDLFSVWNWEPENYTMTGDFEIIELSKQKATIRENITVIDLNNKQTLYFNGVKTYLYNAKWN